MHHINLQNISDRDGNVLKIYKMSHTGLWLSLWAHVAVSFSAILRFCPASLFAYSLQTGIESDYLSRLFFFPAFNTFQLCFFYTEEIDWSFIFIYSCLTANNKLGPCVELVTCPGVNAPNSTKKPPQNRKLHF